MHDFDHLTAKQFMPCPIVGLDVGPKDLDRGSDTSTERDRAHPTNQSAASDGGNVRQIVVRTVRARGSSRRANTFTIASVEHPQEGRPAAVQVRRQAVALSVVVRGVPLDGAHASHPGTYQADALAQLRRRARLEAHLVPS